MSLCRFSKFVDSITDEELRTISKYIIVNTK